MYIENSVYNTITITVKGQLGSRFSNRFMIGREKYTKITPDFSDFATVKAMEMRLIG